MFSLALSSLIFSLILNENFKYSGFFTLLLISIHPVIGLWILSILIISLIINNNKIINLDFCKRSSCWFSCDLNKLLVFYNNSIEKLVFDSNLLEIYLEFWDGHRSRLGILHYEYLIKTLFYLL